MERIAPLAKILAEANGIEWENLPGTGAGGQIVEQDILDYLSRVMSGEAEPPSTPVDPTPPDWTGEDIPGGGMFDASALSQAGVESDIAEFVQQSRSAAPQVPATPTVALETDDFELDDAQDDLLAPQPEVAAAAPVAEVPATPVPVVETPAAEAPVVPPAAAAAATGAAAGGLGSLLSRLYHKEEAPVEPAPVAAPVEVPAAEVPAVEAPKVEVPEVEVPEVAAKAEEPVAAPVAEEPVVAAPVVEQPVEEPVVTKPAPAVTEPQVQEPVAPVPVPTPAAEVPAVAAASAVPRDAVWFGTYLRRSANVAGLTDLRAQLSEALERDVPLALLVARAAQRHADVLGLSSVAVQDVNASQARSVVAGGVREAVQAIDNNYDGTPDLLVVDAGVLDLDDLHYPHTVTLSVGRVQDGQTSLSLQGDVDQAKAAQFLASVASTLEKPVILLV